MKVKGHGMQGMCDVRVRYLQSRGSLREAFLCFKRSELFADRWRKHRRRKVFAGCVGSD